MQDATDDPAPTATLDVGSTADLGPVAAVLVAALPPHAFLALEGDLGAGKTTFVKAIAAAAGVDPREVVSPTFGLVHVHPLPAGVPAGRLVHADLYRLSGSGELLELGWEEFTAAPGWVAAEWARRIAGSLPEDRLDVAIAILSETGRRLVFTARGPRHRPVVGSLARLAVDPTVS